MLADDELSPADQEVEEVQEVVHTIGIGIELFGNVRDRERRIWTMQQHLGAESAEEHEAALHEGLVALAVLLQHLEQFAEDEERDLVLEQQQVPRHELPHEAPATGLRAVMGAIAAALLLPAAFRLPFCEMRVLDQAVKDEAAVDYQGA